LSQTPKWEIRPCCCPGGKDTSVPQIYKSDRVYIAALMECRSCNVQALASRNKIEAFLPQGNDKRVVGTEMTGGQAQSVI
jgi:hypothetical protein